MVDSKRAEYGTRQHTYRGWTILPLPGGPKVWRGDRWYLHTPSWIDEGRVADWDPPESSERYRTLRAARTHLDRLETLPEYVARISEQDLQDLQDLATAK